MWIENTTEKDIPDDESDEEPTMTRTRMTIPTSRRSRRMTRINKKKTTVQEVTHEWELTDTQKSLWMRNPGGHQGGVRHLLQAHQQRLGRSPRCEALPRPWSGSSSSGSHSEGATGSGLPDVLLVIPGRSSSGSGTMAHAKHAA